MPVTLKVGGKTHEVYTGDVSFRGLFICTDAPPTLRQLISLELTLPPDNQRFTSHAMSVFVLEPGQELDHMPGVGVQFYAQGDAQRRQWERFVTQIKDTPPRLPEGAIDPVKRRHPRIAARFEVHPRDVDELATIYSRDVSSGGMFLETDVRLQHGKTLSLTIYHPESHRGFTLESIVRRTSAGPPKGVGVEFTGMDDTRRQRFQRFVDDGVAALDEFEILDSLDEGDDIAATNELGGSDESDESHDDIIVEVDV